MSDTENPTTESQEPQQEAVVEDTTSATEEAAAEAPKENGESQDNQEGQGDGENEAKADGDDAVVAAADADGDGVAPTTDTANGEGEDVQQTEEEGRQLTPTETVEEQPQEPEADCNGTSDEPQAPAEPESEPDSGTAPEPEPEPEPEQEAEEEAIKSPSPMPAITMTEEQLKRCRHYFDRKGVDGRLDIRGFKMLFRLMGEVLSAQDASVMFEEGDRDDNGTIDFDEFCRLYSLHSQEENSRKEAMMASIDKLFPGMDDKPVELKKVKSLLLKMQRPDLDMRLVREKSDLNPGDIHRLVKTMDKDGNGLISKQEFVDTLCKHLDHV